jgi:hypothetical protein
MRPNPRLETLKKCLAFLVEKGRPADQLALAAFRSSHHLIMPSHLLIILACHHLISSHRASISPCYHLISCHRVTRVTLSDDARRLVPLGPMDAAGKKAAAAAVQAMRAGGQTDVSAGLALGLAEAQLGAHGNGVPYCILLSDGEPTSGIRTAEGAENILVDTLCP